MDGGTRDGLHSAWDNGDRNEQEVGESRKNIALEVGGGGRSDECGLFGGQRRRRIGMKTRLRIPSV